MNRDWKIKDIGLFLLGTGALIVAIVIAHWYFLEILPRMHQETGLNLWCTVENGKALIQINANEEIHNIIVNVGDNTCHFDVMYPGTSQVCTAEVNETTVFTVKYQKDGRTIAESGVCRVFERSVPVVD